MKGSMCIGIAAICIAVEADVIIEVSILLLRDLAIGFLLHVV